eukprot:800368-Pelagomonas_calceolata.AAC.2
MHDTQECKKHLEEARQGIDSLRALRREAQQKLREASAELQRSQGVLPTLCLLVMQQCFSCVVFALQSTQVGAPVLAVKAPSMVSHVHLQWNMTFALCACARLFSTLESLALSTKSALAYERIHNLIPRTQLWSAGLPTHARIPSWTRAQVLSTHCSSADRDNACKRSLLASIVRLASSFAGQGTFVKVRRRLCCNAGSVRGPDHAEE